MTDRGKRKVLGPPELPVIDPGYCEEASFTSSKDDLVLYLKRWIPTKAISPSEPPRALVAFCHGFIEHYGRYENIFKLFAQANIAVTAFDQRGFGRTWSKAPNPNKAHGNTTWKQQFKDIEDFIRLERARTDAKYGKDRVPIYLMGHSMVSLYCIERPCWVLMIIISYKCREVVLLVAFLQDQSTRMKIQALKSRT